MFSSRNSSLSSHTGWTFWLWMTWASISRCSQLALNFIKNIQLRCVWKNATVLYITAPIQVLCIAASDWRAFPTRFEALWQRPDRLKTLRQRPYSLKTLWQRNFQNLYFSFLQRHYDQPLCLFCEEFRTNRLLCEKEMVLSTKVDVYIEHSNFWRTKHNL